MTTEQAQPSRKRASNPNRGAKPGERRGGRQKGTPNKTTALLKDAVLKAAENAGGKGGLVSYLQEQAISNPGPFLALLGKVLPMQVTGADGGPIQSESKANIEIDVSGLSLEVQRAIAQVKLG